MYIYKSIISRKSKKNPGTSYVESDFSLVKSITTEGKTHLSNISIDTNIFVDTKMVVCHAI